MKSFYLKKRMEPVVFMRQLATMVTAGIAINRCFEILEQMQTSTVMRMSVHRIRQQLLAGNNLHTSMQHLPSWHDAFSTHLIHFGEQTGKLELILITLARYHENKITLQNKLRTALFYPGIILVTAILLLFTLFIFVLPAFAELFHESSQTLPWLTQLLFATATFLNQHLILMQGIFTIILFSLWVTRYYQRLIAFCSKHIWRLPPIKYCAQTLMLVRFTRHLGIALTAGVPIQHALALAADIGSNASMAHALIKLRQAVTSGKSLHGAMAGLPAFPVLIQQMIKVGEESGSLDVLLEKSADLLEAELHTHISHLTALLEPLIMAILGVLIGGLVVGIYLPVFNLGSTL